MKASIHLAQRRISRVGAAAAWFSDRFMPDAWIYAVLLTGIAMAGAVVFTPTSFQATVLAWQNELWNKDVLLLVGQFSINLILCTALAHAPLVQRGLERLAAAPRTAVGAVWSIGTVSILLSWVSWALCIIGGALFAQEVCRQARRRGLRLHYPLAIATGYLGMMTWGCGLTSSAPLISATPGHFMQAAIGVIPISATLGSATNLVIALALFAACPVFMALLHPLEPKQVVELAPPAVREAPAPALGSSFADRMEGSFWLLKAIALLPASYFVHHFFVLRKGLTIDSMNLVFLTAAMLLYRTPRDMLAQLSRSSASVWAIAFQFPFYAGLMGVIRNTGLAQLIANAFSSMSTPATWPVIGLSSQAFLNLFIPSGGTQWIVTADVLVGTCQAMGCSIPQAILIEVMGDQLANMLTPMWALPALALAGLRARDIMGYTGVVMALGFVIMALGLTFIPA